MYIVLINCGIWKDAHVLTDEKGVNRIFEHYIGAQSVADSYVGGIVIGEENAENDKDVKQEQEERSNEKDLSLAIGDLVLNVIKYFKKM